MKKLFEIFKGNKAEPPVNEALDAILYQLPATNHSMQATAHKIGQNLAQKQSSNLAYGTLGYAGPSNPSIVGASKLIYTIRSPSGKEIVSVGKNGDVIWPNGIDVGAAAEAFSKTLYLGVERAAGVTDGMRQRTRDAVFKELINLVNETESVTSAELTRYWEAAKIIDKLKGIE